MSDKLLAERLRIEAGSDRRRRDSPAAHAFVTELDAEWADYLPAASYDRPYAVPKVGWLA